ncbi:hypothetical protein [Allorhizobium borbori]|uniref:Uncharacterized protein n=1 Tax=Allorhizobium borbori TaxID=485907 RepID=A0A7W6JZI9_9HYPH|nr:hypothetical protein [Allorhizobium borbori]MBB4102417.1 hypothetical protein [Allorhizobium borbori]
MLARFAAALTAAFQMIGKVGKWSWDVAVATVRFPFELISTKPPLPQFNPTVEKSDVLDEYNEARKRHAAVQTLDRDGIHTLLEYCRAHRDDRATMKLPKDLPPPVLASLVSMDDKALRSLATAGVGQVRKFMSGKPHGIHGVPAVAPDPDVVPTAADDEPPRNASHHERVLWKIRANMLKDRQSEFRAPAPR